jgi:hypothetical protein
MTKVRIGYEFSSGRPVELPLQHIAVYGLTRQAGKTTALEGMISRLEHTTVLVLRTGKNEIPFDRATRIFPFFRERYDWRYVEGLLWSFLQERPKVYRTWVMRATQGARSLRDVHERIVKAGKKATRGWDQDLLYQLDHYFQEILPGLEALDLHTDLDLKPNAVNVMDLENVGLATQQLIVGAVLDHLMEHPEPAVVVLPEARDFLPSDRSTPAKLAADQFVRRGAKMGLYLWIDSQSLTGVDQQMIRNFGLSLHGRQTSDIEIARIVKAVDHGVTARDVKGLRLGEFLVEDQDGVRKVYAQPAWMGDDAARRVALGEIRANQVKRIPQEEANVDEKERKEYEDRVKTLVADKTRLERTVRDQEVRLKNLEEAVREANGRAEANAIEKVKGSTAPSEFTRLLDETAAHAAGERTKADVHVFTETPELTVHVRVVTVEANDEELLGQLAILTADGFFDAMTSSGPVVKELAARGWGNRSGGSGRMQLLEKLRLMCSYGFLRELNSMFQVVPEAKARIRRVDEEARVTPRGGT